MFFTGRKKMEECRYYGNLTQGYRLGIRAFTGDRGKVAELKKVVIEKIKTTE